MMEYFNYPSLRYAATLLRRGRLRLHIRPCEEFLSSAAIHLSILARSSLAPRQGRKKEDGLPRRARALLARTDVGGVATLLEPGFCLCQGFDRQAQ